jgi:O-antigen/teichoic acid export membrane protein
VGALFGGNWQESARILPWALAATTVTALGQTAYSLLLASCRQGKCMLYDLARLAGLMMVLALWPLHHSMNTYLASLTAVESVLVLQLYAWLIGAQAADVRGLSSALVAPLVAAAVGLVVTRTAIPEAGLISLWSVPAVVACGLFGLTYLLTLRVLFARPLARLLAVAPMQRQLRQLMLLSAEVVA